MMVQIITIPPTEAARAMRTIKVVLVVVEVEPLVAGTALVELGSEEVRVLTVVVAWF